MVKKNIVFDFDGVIHSYTSGWKGSDAILDKPVDGIKEAIKEIREAGYNVIVVSSRCDSEKGMNAVRTYLDYYKIMVDDIMSKKPPAIAYIDDRAICFDGKPGDLLEKIRKFKTWQGRKG